MIIILEENQNIRASTSLQSSVLPPGSVGRPYNYCPFQTAAENISNMLLAPSASVSNDQSG